jgi:hypothetical protein
LRYRHEPESQLTINHGFAEFGGMRRRYAECGHWIQNEAVAKVNDALLDFLGRESLAMN